jgi:protein involved in polysaccharide export with SLBB domain
VTIVDLTGPSVKSSFTPLVEADGKVAMPLVSPISMAGLKPVDAALAVRKSYRDANLIGNADVTIEVAEASASASTRRGNLQAGEEIQVRIWDLDGPGLETSKKLTVDDHGEIAMPRVGNVKVSGSLERDAAGAIGTAYFNANLLANPIVDVTRIHTP